MYTGFCNGFFKPTAENHGVENGADARESTLLINENNRDPESGSENSKPEIECTPLNALALTCAAVCCLGTAAALPIGVGIATKSLAIGLAVAGAEACLVVDTLCIARCCS